jgi:hypothetical protein
MSEGWGQADFMAARRVDESPAETASRMARQAAERADRQAEQEEAERAAAAEDARDQRLFRLSQLGLAGRSVADVFRDAAAAGDEDAEYESARATMARIERRREQRQEAVRYQAEQLAEVAQRSAITDPLEAASLRAAKGLAVHRDDVLRRARATQQRPAPIRAGRPFGDSGASRNSVPAPGERRLPPADGLACREITRVCTPDGNVNWGPVIYR